MGIGRWRVEGLVEGVWLLQRGGWLDAAEMRRWGDALRGEEAAGQVDAWFPDGWGDAAGASTLADIAAELGEERWSHDAEARQWLKDLLRRALRDGRLIAVRMGIPAPAEAAAEREEEPAPEPARRVETAWIEIVLTTDDDPPRPVPYRRYSIELPDGSVRTGQLDQNGIARLTGIDPGTCQVSFPDFDARRWRRA